MTVAEPRRWVDGRPLRVCFATPTHSGEIHMGTMRTLRALDGWCSHAGIETYQAYYRGPHICHGRDVMVLDALRVEATHVLFLDADLEVGPVGWLGMLLDTMAETTAEIVAGLYCNKPVGGDGATGLADGPLVYASAQTDEPPEAPPATLRWRSLTAPLPPGPIAPPAGGGLLASTGLMLIDARLLARMPAPWFEFQEIYGPRPGAGPDAPRERYLIPEDWWFCHRARRYDGRTVIDPRLETRHYGPCGWAHHAPVAGALACGLPAHLRAIAGHVVSGRRAEALGAVEALSRAIAEAPVPYPSRASEE